MINEQLKWYHYLDFKKRNLYKYGNPKSFISITEIIPNKKYQANIDMTEYGNKIKIFDTLKDAMTYIEKGLYK